MYDVAKSTLPVKLFGKNAAETVYAGFLRQRKAMNQMLYQLECKERREGGALRTHAGKDL